MGRQGGQGPTLIHSHEAAVPRGVGAEDNGKLPISFFSGQGDSPSSVHFQCRGRNSVAGEKGENPHCASHYRGEKRLPHVAIKPGYRMNLQVQRESVKCGMPRRGRTNRRPDQYYKKTGAQGESGLPFVIAMVRHTGRNRAWTKPGTAERKLSPYPDSFSCSSKRTEPSGSVLSTDGYLGVTSS